ncbi:MAG: META domain-containing protein [Comamonadaceae bacterium]|nr:META domain-containing protein [Comamonadaceae bacterium]
MHPTLYRPALVLTTALAASLHLLGCASGNTADAPPVRLDASSWVVAALRGSALVTGQTVTLRFEQGRVTGSDGCNRYSAAYRQDGPAGLSIDPSTQISTQMACPPPIDQFASAYRLALAQTRQVRLDAGRLVLLDGNGQNLATLEAQATGLAGSQWQVTAVNNGRQAVVSVAPGSELRLRFGADGAVSGSAGCNSFSGSYQTHGASVTFGPVATTRRMCNTPAGVMEQEGQFLKALQSATAWRREGDRLELRTATGALALSLQALEEGR